MVEIIREMERRFAGRGAKAALAKQFDLPKSTLSTIIRRKSKLLDCYKQSTIAPSKKKKRMSSPLLLLQEKRLRTAAYADVEEPLVSWMRFAKSKNTHYREPHSDLMFAQSFVKIKKISFNIILYKSFLTPR